MGLSFDDIGPLLGQTLRDPEGAAQRIRDADLPSEADLLSAGAVVAVAAALYGFSVLIFPPVEGPDVFAPPPPFGAAVMIAVSLLLTAAAARGLGAMFGGQGSFRQSLRLMVWLQAVGCVMQAAQLLLSMVSPALGSLSAFGILGYSMFLLVCFVKVLHGFASRAQVFLGVLGVILAVSVLLAILLPSLVAAGGAA